MMHSFKTLRGYEIAARDGAIGEVDDLYFDDRYWLLRYFVVRTGGWLSGREVLIAPEAASAPDHGQKTLPVSLNREQVKESPGIATDLPVEARNEQALRDHYGWSDVVVAGVGAGPLLYPGLLPGDDEEMEDPPKGDPNLRSARSVEGYAIEASDGRIGAVSDYLLDDEGWVLRYLVVETGNWLFSKHKVLIAPNWARDIDWTERMVGVGMTREQVESSPTYDPEKPVERDYESALHGHYDRAAYWP